MVIRTKEMLRAGLTSKKTAGCFGTGFQDVIGVVPASAIPERVFAAATTGSPTLTGGHGGAGCWCRNWGDDYRFDLIAPPALDVGIDRDRQHDRQDDGHQHQRDTWR